MPKVTAGTQIPNTTYQSINGDTIRVPSENHRFTHLQFRRFAGCPICNMHLQQFSAEAERLAAEGIQEVIFFHSSESALRKYNSQLPFPVVADPNKSHYRKFGVEASVLSILHPSAILNGLRGVLKQGLGLSLQNGPLGLPADFLIDQTGTIVAAKYGTHAYDQWSLEELIQHCEQATLNEDTPLTNAIIAIHKPV